ncbi:PEP-CTERM/exosortase system-associated acyltransferase [Rheinheimera gaetbuli]
MMQFKSDNKQDDADSPRDAAIESVHISEHFSHFLQPQLADTPQLKTEVYQLRHQIYCEELHFEQTNEDKIEKDAFDERALHCVIRHLQSQRLAGTVRLITSTSNDELLPLEQYCAAALDNPKLAPSRFERHEICEISRLAVPSSFRKREIDQYEGAATGVLNEKTFSSHEFRCFPYIPICLYLSAAAMSYRTRRYHAFVMMEPLLARSMSFVGIKFKQVGDTIEFHGKRAAYYVDSRELKQTLKPLYLNLLNMVEKEIFGASQS